MIANYCWSIKRNLNNIEHDRQSRNRSYVHEGFISAASLLNDLIKILVGLDIFNHVIFNDLRSDCYCKNSISQ